MSATAAALARAPQCAARAPSLRHAPDAACAALPAPQRLPRRQHRRLSCRAESGTGTKGSGGGGGGLGALLTAAKEQPQTLEWQRATVVENREASADGSVRTLLLSVEDRVTFLEGRKVRHVQESRRWIDGYKVPGQFVAARYCAPGSGGGSGTEECGELRTAGRLLCLASSPYEARRDSALLDASLVELLVSRAGDADERVLAELGPGTQVDVSRVAGDGFTSLFDPELSLMTALESGHPLLVVAAGTRGIAPVRAALSWTPVLAHAGSSAVSVFYVASSQASAAYLKEWDGWREAGVQVHPLYLGEAGAAATEALLERALFEGEGLKGLLRGAHARDAAVLLSGLEGEVAAALTRHLTQHGVPSERILVCDM